MTMVKRATVLGGIVLGACVFGCGSDPQTDGETAATQAAEAPLVQGLTPLPIFNAYSAKVLEIGGGSGADGARANQWSFVNDLAHLPWQFWGFRRMGTSSNFEIVNQSSGKCLEIGGFAQTAGAGANQW